MNILDAIKTDAVVPEQDIGTATVTGTVYVTAARARRIMGNATCAALTSAQTLTVQLMQATSAGGAGAKVLGGLITQTAPGGGALGNVSVEVATDSLDAANNFTFVGLQVKASPAGKVGSGRILRLQDDLPAN